MAEHQPTSVPSLTVPHDQPLIGLILEQDGQEVTQYFADEAQADAAVAATTLADARALAGAWSDLDWEEMVKALDRIRHGSQPTPPIEL